VVLEGTGRKITACNERQSKRMPMLLLERLLPRLLAY
jgi:hypothetical protein